MTSRTDRFAPAAGRAGPAAGFTIIEVLVVLVVLSLAAGIVLSRGAPRSARLEARAQASQIIQGLRAARGQAIATNRDTPFSIDRARRSFRVGAGPEHQLPATVQVDARAANAPAGIPSIPSGAIVFAPDGSASGGLITLAVGTVRIDIAVDWLTGRVSSADAP